MSYYVKCPDCGANLDPGERCDCDIVILKQKKNSPPTKGSCLINEQASDIGYLRYNYIIANAVQ